jgi:putative spermidine/putrescine transport system ATP-binding protein
MGVTLTAAVQLIAVRKQFGDVTAVDDVNLSIGDGEFFSLLGPSGSGKTTVLRMIAGFDLPTAGNVLLNGVDVTSTPPYDRDVNTVFQDYALFPHMTVRENVEYGLRVRGVARAERRKQAEQMLEVVRLPDFGNRKPSEMSGGQRQRVALARALVNHPSVLLLDEPLGALDLKLREEMQTELKSIQREVGITFIFVTHDQGEALSMSSRIAVFNHGRIEQIGTPREIYEHPATSFVAGFVGSSNVMNDEVSQRLLGQPGAHSIRPERIRVADNDRRDDEISATGTISEVLYLGAEIRIAVNLDAGGRLTCTHPGADSRPMAPGDRIEIAFLRTAALNLLTETGT